MKNNFLHNLFGKVAILTVMLLASHCAISQSDPDSTLKEVVLDSTVFNFEENNEYKDEYEEQEADTVTSFSSRVSDTVILREVPDSTVKRLKEDKEFEYANNPEFWVKEKPRESQRGIGYFIEWLFSSALVRILAYLLIGGVLLYAIYRVIVNNSLFYTPSRKKAGEMQEEENEMEAGDIDEKIEQAIAAKDFRKAVRYFYIKSLRSLNDKGWIQYHSQATNYDYLRQLANKPAAGDFGFLTRAYEYVWYGEFELSELQFEFVRENFDKFLKAIKA